MPALFTTETTSGRLLSDSLVGDSVLVGQPVDTGVHLIVSVDDDPVMTPNEATNANRVLLGTRHSDYSHLPDVWRANVVMEAHTTSEGEVRPRTRVQGDMLVEALETPAAYATLRTPHQPYVTRLGALEDLVVDGTLSIASDLRTLGATTLCGDVLAETSVRVQGGALLAGGLSVVGDLVLDGNLIVHTDVIASTTLTEEFLKVTERVVVSNDGTGPALEVLQTGANPIAVFSDETGERVRLSDEGWLGIGRSPVPQAALHVTHGDAWFEESARVGGTLSVAHAEAVTLSAANATFASALSVGAAFAVDATLSTCRLSQLRVDHALSVHGATILRGDTTLDTTLSVGGAATFSAGADFAAPTTFRETLSVGEDVLVGLGVSVGGDVVAAGDLRAARALVPQLSAHGAAVGALVATDALVATLSVTSSHVQQDAVVDNTLRVNSTMFADADLRVRGALSVAGALVGSSVLAEHVATNSVELSPDAAVATLRTGTALLLTASDAVEVASALRVTGTVHMEGDVVVGGTPLTDLIDEVKVNVQDARFSNVFVRTALTAADATVNGTLAVGDVPDVAAAIHAVRTAPTFASAQVTGDATVGGTLAVGEVADVAAAIQAVRTDPTFATAQVTDTLTANTVVADTITLNQESVADLIAAAATPPTDPVYHSLVVDTALSVGTGLTVGGVDAVLQDLDVTLSNAEVRSNLVVHGAFSLQGVDLATRLQALEDTTGGVVADMTTLTVSDTATFDGVVAFNDTLLLGGENILALIAAGGGTGNDGGTVDLSDVRSDVRLHPSATLSVAGPTHLVAGASVTGGLHTDALTIAGETLAAFVGEEVSRSFVHPTFDTLRVRGPALLEGDVTVGDTTLDAIVASIPHKTNPRFETVYASSNVTIDGDVVLQGVSLHTTLAAIPGHDADFSNVFVNGALSVRNALYIGGNDVGAMLDRIPSSDAYFSNLQVRYDLDVKGQLTLGGQNVESILEQIQGPSPTLQAVRVEESLSVAGRTTLHGGLVLGLTDVQEAIATIPGKDPRFSNLFVKDQVDLAGTLKLGAVDVGERLNAIPGASPTFDNLTVNHTVQVLDTLRVGDVDVLASVLSLAESIPGDAPVFPSLVVQNALSVKEAHLDGSDLGARIRTIEDALPGTSPVFDTLVLQSSLSVGSFYMNGRTFDEAVAIVSKSDLRASNLYVKEDIELHGDLFLGTDSLTHLLGTIPGAHPVFTSAKVEQHLSVGSVTVGGLDLVSAVVHDLPSMDVDVRSVTIGGANLASTIVADMTSRAVDVASLTVGGNARINGTLSVQSLEVGDTSLGDAFVTDLATKSVGLARLSVGTDAVVENTLSAGSIAVGGRTLVGAVVDGLSTQDVTVRQLRTTEGGFVRGALSTGAVTTDALEVGGQPWIDAVVDGVATRHVAAIRVSADEMVLDGQDIGTTLATIASGLPGDTPVFAALTVAGDADLGGTLRVDGAPIHSHVRDLLATAEVHAYDLSVGRDAHVDGALYVDGVDVVALASSGFTGDAQVSALSVAGDAHVDGRLFVGTTDVLALAATGQTANATFDTVEVNDSMTLQGVDLMTLVGTGQVQNAVFDTATVAQKLSVGFNVYVGSGDDAVDLLATITDLREEVSATERTFRNLGVTHALSVGTALHVQGENVGEALGAIRASVPGADSVFDNLGVTHALSVASAIHLGATDVGSELLSLREDLPGPTPTFRDVKATRTLSVSDAIYIDTEDVGLALAALRADLPGRTPVFDSATVAGRTSTGSLRVGGLPVEDVTIDAIASRLLPVRALSVYTDAFVGGSLVVGGTDVETTVLSVAGRLDAANVALQGLVVAQDVAVEGDVRIGGTPVLDLVRAMEHSNVRFSNVFVGTDLEVHGAIKLGTLDVGAEFASIQTAVDRIPADAPVFSGPTTVTSTLSVTGPLYLDGMDILDRLATIPVTVDTDSLDIVNATVSDDLVVRHVNVFDALQTIPSAAAQSDPSFDTLFVGGDATLVGRLVLGTVDVGEMLGTIPSATPVFDSLGVAADVTVNGNAVVHGSLTVQDVDVLARLGDIPDADATFATVSTTGAVTVGGSLLLGARDVGAELDRIPAASPVFDSVSVTGALSVGADLFLGTTNVADELQKIAGRTPEFDQVGVVGDVTVDGIAHLQRIYLGGTDLSATLATIPTQTPNFQDVTVRENLILNGTVTVDDVDVKDVLLGPRAQGADATYTSVTTAALTTADAFVGTLSVGSAVMTNAVGTDLSVASLAATDAIVPTLSVGDAAMANAVVAGTLSVASLAATSTIIMDQLSVGSEIYLNGKNINELLSDTVTGSDANFDTVGIAQALSVTGPVSIDGVLRVDGESVWVGVDTRVDARVDTRVDARVDVAVNDFVVTRLDELVEARANAVAYADVACSNLYAVHDARVNGDLYADSAEITTDLVVHGVLNANGSIVVQGDLEVTGEVRRNGVPIETVEEGDPPSDPDPYMLSLQTRMPEGFLQVYGDVEDPTAGISVLVDVGVALNWWNDRSAVSLYGRSVGRTRILPMNVAHYGIDLQTLEELDRRPTPFQATAIITAPVRDADESYGVYVHGNAAPSANDYMHLDVLRPGEDAFARKLKADYQHARPGERAVESSVRGGVHPTIDTLYYVTLVTTYDGTWRFNSTMVEHAPSPEGYDMLHYARHVPPEGVAIATNAYDRLRYAHRLEAGIWVKTPDLSLFPRARFVSWQNDLRGRVLDATYAPWVGWSGAPEAVAPDAGATFGALMARGQLYPLFRTTCAYVKSGSAALVTQDARLEQHFDAMVQRYHDAGEAPLVFDPETQHARFAASALPLEVLVTLPVMMSRTRRTDTDTRIQTTLLNRTGVSAAMYPVTVSLRVRYDSASSGPPVFAAGPGATLSSQGPNAEYVPEAGYDAEHLAAFEVATMVSIAELCTAIFDTGIANAISLPTTLLTRDGFVVEIA